jgi:hypothetical protein
MLKLRESASANKKIIFFSLAFMFAVYCASAVQVSVILEDKSRFMDGNITHEVTAYNDVNNVTIIDYFSDVKVQGIDAEKEEFLGKEWLAVKIHIGDMKNGERKTLTYNILSGAGDVMLGGDFYYIEGERHQLFPEKTTIEVKPAASYTEIINESINESGSTKPEESSQNYLPYILLLVVVILLFIIVLKLKKHKK